MTIADLKKIFGQNSLPYIKPLYSVEYKEESEFLSWIKNADSSCEDYTQRLFREQEINLNCFLYGGGSAKQINQTILYAPNVDTKEMEGIDVNEVYRITMDQVSTVVSNELVPEVIPASLSYSDKQAARYTKEWLDSMDYELDIDEKRFQWEVQKKIFGEAFVIPKWNDELGPLDAAIKDFKDEDLYFEDGDDDDKEKVAIDKDTRTGEIELVNPLPFNVQIEPRNTYKDSDWFWYTEYLGIDYLEKKYPDIKWEAKSIKVKQGSEKSYSSDNLIKVYNFYHRSHTFLPEGWFVICTEDHVLVSKSLEDCPSLIDYKKLPLVRFLDLNAGLGGVRGQPILYRNLKPLVSGYNRITNQVYNNLEAGSPKFMIHEDTGVDIQRMPNGVVVMEWKGTHKPTIETPVTNQSDIFKFREDIQKNIMEMGFQTPMTRGDTPNAQLDSFIALQHFEDIRNQQASPDIKNHMAGLRMLYKLMIIIALDNYDSEDYKDGSKGRLIKIVGRNDSVNLKYFNPDNLARADDVRIKSTGNMANSKAAKTQEMVTVKEKFPQIVSDEMLVEQLGLGSNEKFRSFIVGSINSAEAENEDMYHGKSIAEAEQHEDLISHWEVHRIPLQTIDYKQSPKKVKEAFMNHVMGTEKLMMIMASKSETFNARLVSLRQFPLFYEAVPEGIDPTKTGEIPVEEDLENEPIPEEETPQPPIMEDGQLSM
jgi:hypothetical protein